MPAPPICIGIIGDFNPDYGSHHATNAALSHAAWALGRDVRADWLPTPSLLEPGADQILARCDGLWAASGSPYGSMAGALAGIQFARVRNWPFAGT